MNETIISFPVTHEGRAYTVRVGICAGCLLAEMAALLATGETQRAYGAGDGAFTLVIAPAEATHTANGVAHEGAA